LVAAFISILNAATGALTLVELVATVSAFLAVGFCTLAAGVNAIHPPHPPGSFT
jgi:hypothetical protein